MSKNAPILACNFDFKALVKLNSKIFEKKICTKKIGAKAASFMLMKLTPAIHIAWPL